MYSEEDINEKESYISEKLPLKSGKIQKESKNFVKFFYLFGLVFVPFFIAIQVIMSKTSDDCKNPVRIWLIIVSIIYVLNIFVGLVECISGMMSKLGICVTFLYILLELFQFSWHIIGSIWLFTDNNNKSFNLLTDLAPVTGIQAM